jgi:hypothetical protein
MRFRRTIGGYAILVEEIDGERYIGRVYKSRKRGWVARAQGTPPIERSGDSRLRAAANLYWALQWLGRTP